MDTIYSTTAHAAAGREGVTALEDGTLSFDLSAPGSGKPGTNPEQLFALGYAACFDSAAKAVARRMKLPLEASETHATVNLTKGDNRFRLVVKIGLMTKGLIGAPSELEALWRMMRGFHFRRPIATAQGARLSKACVRPAARWVPGG